jgi:ketosteroid isomerase-like protein
MRRSTFGFAALLVLLAGCALSPRNPEAAIRALEQRQAQAAVAGDRAALEKVFAPGFRLINPSGAVASRAELLAMLGSGTPPYRAAAYATESVQSYGRVVVTTGTENVEYASNGQKQQRRVTQVWEQAGDGWQLVLRHATLVAPPAP